MSIQTLSIFFVSIITLSTNSFAYTLTGNPACSAGTFVTNYTSCSGAYELGPGENDVTNGDASNIATMLLNPGNLFGVADWTFLSKEDDSNNSPDFNINLNVTSGNLTFNNFASLTGYDLTLSLKSANSFSMYYWVAGSYGSSISWTTNGVSTNKQGTPQALSHGSVYLRYNDSPPPPPPTPTAEPGLFILFGLGLIGMAISRKQS